MFGKHSRQKHAADAARDDHRRADDVEYEAVDKPDSPADLTKPSWVYVVRKTFREFSDDQCTDLAAALTYFSILALFPAAIALLSLVGLVGQGKETVDTLLDILRDVGASSAADTLEPTLTQLSQSQGAGIGLIIGLAVALWSASGYVGAFGRGMNRIYEIDEGRPIWKLRPAMLLVTLVTVVLTAIVALGLVLTGPAAQAVGNALGLGSTVVTVWNIAKWPVLVVVVVLIVALLYYATPNVKQPKFRWISIGAIVAILTWIVASAAFGFYVANFASYNKTYGSLAGSSCSSSGCGLRTWPCSSGPSSTPSSNAAASSRPACPPRRSSSSPPATPARATRPPRMNKPTSTAADSYDSLADKPGTRVTTKTPAAPPPTVKGRHDELREANQQDRRHPLPTVGAGRQPARRPDRRGNLPASVEATGP